MVQLVEANDILLFTAVVTDAAHEVSIPPAMHLHVFEIMLLQLSLEGTFGTVVVQVLPYGHLVT